MITSIKGVTYGVFNCVVVGSELITIENTPYHTMITREKLLNYEQIFMPIQYSLDRFIEMVSRLSDFKAKHKNRK